MRRWHDESNKRAEIEQWRRDLAAIPGRMQGLERGISSYQAELEKLKPKLSFILSQMLPIENAIAALRAQINMLTLPRKRDELARRIFQHMQILSELQIQLEAVTMQIAPMLERQRAALQAQIAAQQKTKNQLASELLDLNSTLAKSQPLSAPYASNIDPSDLEKQLYKQHELHHQLKAESVIVKRGIDLRNAQIHSSWLALAELEAKKSYLVDALLYQDALNRFYALLHDCVPDHPSPETLDFYEKGKVMLDRIVEQKNLSETPSGFMFNNKLHADILNTASEMLLTPESLQLHEDLAGHAEHVTDGKLSVGKTVWGAVGLFIAGAAAIIGGLGLGGALPVISWPLSIAGIAGGVLLFAGGLTLLVQGRQKGEDKAIADFNKAYMSPHIAASMFRRVVQQDIQLKVSAPVMGM